MRYIFLVMLMLSSISQTLAQEPMEILHFEAPPSDFDIIAREVGLASLLDAPKQHTLAEAQRAYKQLPKILAKHPQGKEFLEQFQNVLLNKLITKYDLASETNPSEVAYFAQEISRLRYLLSATDEAEFKWLSNALPILRQHWSARRVQTFKSSYVRYYSQYVQGIREAEQRFVASKSANERIKYAFRTQLEDYERVMKMLQDF